MCGVSLLPVMAAAQQTASLEEIVVTATKHSESLAKVPISIAAFSADDLEASGVKSFADLASVAPGVQFNISAGWGPGTATNIAIRGVNSSVGTSTTGLYIDDTPIQARVTSLSFFGNPLPLMFDVSRVEVERGPQGTLFGAGAEGGAVRFISPEPSLTQYSGQVRSEVSITDGGDPSYEAGAAVGGPIVEGKLGFRASAWYRSDGGYVDRVDPIGGSTVEANADSSASEAFRAALAFAPTDWLTLTPSFYDQSVRKHDASTYFEYLSNADDGQFRNGRLLRQPSADSFYLPSLKIEADLGSVALTSVTSYLGRSGRLIDDLTSYVGSSLGLYLPYGNPLGAAYPASYADAAPAVETTSFRQLSQEIRLGSNDAAAPLQWTLGGFYSHTTQKDAERAFGAFYNNNLFGLPGNVPTFASSLSSEDSQLAVFGQADYHILDRLTVTVGLRVARTRSNFEEDQSGPIADPADPHSTGSQSETPVTPKVGLSYQITDSEMVYASVAKGYRTGGANPAIPLKSAADPAGCPMSSEPGSYNSDKVWSYEVGSKGRFLDNRLSLDGSLFHVDWSNIQQEMIMTSCGFGYIANTGNAKSNGFDFNSRAALTENLMAGLSVSYTDAKMTKDVSILGVPVEQAGDAIGSPPNVISPWNITASLTYDFSLFGRDSYIRAEDIYRSHNSGPFNTLIAASATYAPDIPADPATNQLNLRAGVTWSGLDLSLFANNVLNSHPALGRYQDNIYSTLFTDNTIRPLTVGATASYRF